MRKVLITSNSEYRIKPYSKIKSDDIEFTLCGTLIHDPFKYDAILLHQPITPIFPQMIQDLQSEGKKVVVDVDDNILDIPYQNDSFDQVNSNNNRKTFLECIRLCDYVHVSTPELRTKLKKSYKTTVFYNGIDLSLYGEKDNSVRAEYNIPDDHKIVMWAGSPTHADSVILIIPLIEELIKRGDVTVVLCSNELWMKSYFPHGVPDNVKIIGYLSFDRYTKLLGIADVFLAPLPHNAFNECKSELKALESGAHKVPCVASSVAPYNRFKELSGEGIRIVAKERLNLWLKEVDKLLTNEMMRRITGEVAHMTIQTHYNIETINQDRIKFWKRILTD